MQGMLVQLQRVFRLGQGLSDGRGSGGIFRDGTGTGAPAEVENRSGFVAGARIDVGQVSGSDVVRDSGFWIRGMAGLWGRRRGNSHVSTKDREERSEEREKAVMRACPVLSLVKVRIGRRRLLAVLVVPFYLCVCA